MSAMSRPAEPPTIRTRADLVRAAAAAPCESIRRWYCNRVAELDGRDIPYPPAVPPRPRRRPCRGAGPSPLPGF